MTDVAMWLRVSRRAQDYENQRRQLDALVQARGYHLVRTFEIKASAYTSAHEPELAAMLEAARNGAFKVLVCWALDRLSREGAAETLMLVHRLRQSGVQVVSLQEPWLEVAGEFGDVLVTLMGWVARYESGRKSERVHAGLARARAEGKAIGRPAVLQHVDGDLVRGMRAQGASWSMIRKAHPATIMDPETGRKHKPSTASIRRACQNPVGAAEAVPA